MKMSVLPSARARARSWSRCAFPPFGSLSTLETYRLGIAGVTEHGRLGAEGLVETSPGRGVFVTGSPRR
jgi:hypothetical protein